MSQQGLSLEPYKNQALMDIPPPKMPFFSKIMSQQGLSLEPYKNQALMDIPPPKMKKE